MNRYSHLLFALLLALWTLTACATLQPPAARFSNTHRDFLQLLRWQDFEGAAQYLEEPYRKEFLRQFRPLDDLRIVDVQAESVTPGKTENRMVTRTVMQYYLLPSIAVKKFRFRLEWQYLGGDAHHLGTWRIVSAFPAFP